MSLVEDLAYEGWRMDGKKARHDRPEDDDSGSDFTHEEAFHPSFPVIEEGRLVGLVTEGKSVRSLSPLLLRS